MNKLVVIIIAFLLVLDFGLTGTVAVRYYKANNELAALKTQAKNLESRITGATINSLVTNPGRYFDVISEHPEWEKIDAVPYSSCYRHLIGTSTADYIVCMAI